MPTIDLVINGNRHTVSCNDGEESRLKLLADKFNAKLGQITPSLQQVDDKTLYLITALVLLDEIEENKHVSNESINSAQEKAFIKNISNKIAYIKQILS